MLLSFSILAIAAFATTSFLTIYEPKPRTFDGYVTLLAEDSENVEAQILIQMLDDGTSTSPLIDLTVTLCGEGRFSGVLLFGGDATLGEFPETGAIWFGPPVKGKGPEAWDVPSPTVTTYDGPVTLFKREVAYLHGDQGYQLSAQSLPPCSHSESLEKRALHDWGVTFYVTGRFRAPISNIRKALDVSPSRTLYSLRFSQ